METRFLHLPPEIRNQIYRQLLVLPEPMRLSKTTGSKVRMYYTESSHKVSPCKRLWLDIIYTSKAIYNEAIPILYSKNSFSLRSRKFESDVLVAFLEIIGSRNASFLAHIIIPMPIVELHQTAVSETTERDENYQVFPGNLPEEKNRRYNSPHRYSSKGLSESRRLLDVISTKCPGLKVLETLDSMSNEFEEAMDKIANSAIVSKAVSDADLEFKTVKSLRKIIINLYEGTLTSTVRRLMTKHGWTIQLMKDPRPKKRQDWEREWEEWQEYCDLTSGNWELWD